MHFKSNNLKIRLVSFVCVLLILSGLFVPTLNAEDEGTNERVMPYELLPGDLKPSEVRNAVLSDSDLPDVISRSLADARGHANRLYLQEPDNYTVIFQNRDMTKTVYIFSMPVKGASGDLPLSAVNAQSSGASALFALGKNGISFTSETGYISKFRSNAGTSALRDYNIGLADLQYLTSGVMTAEGINISADVRGWTEGATGTPYTLTPSKLGEVSLKLDADSQAVLRPDPAATPIAVMSVNVSFLAGYKIFVNYVTNKQLIYLNAADPYVTTGINTNNIWLVTYSESGEYYIQPHRINQNIQNPWYLITDADCRALELSQTRADDWRLFSDDNGGLLIVTSGDDYLVDSDTTMTMADDLYGGEYPDSCRWNLSYNAPYVTDIDVVDLVYSRSRYVYYTDFTTILPAGDVICDLSWYNAANDDPIYFVDGEEYFELEYGINSIYCYESNSNITSDTVTVIVNNFPGADSKKTYSIHPYGADAVYLTRIEDNGNVSLSASQLNHGQTANATYYSVDGYTQTFVVETTTDNKYTIGATVNSNQYAATAPSSAAVRNQYSSLDNYSLVQMSDFANYLKFSSSNQLTFGMKTDTNNSWCIVPVGNSGYYAIVTAVIENGNNVVKGLRYFNDQVSFAEYTENDTSFLWKFDSIGINVPLIMQTTKYYCGPATFLQSMYGAGFENYISGTRLTDKQDQLAIALQTTSADGTSRRSEFNLVGIAESINQCTQFTNNTQYRYHRYQINDTTPEDSSFVNKELSQQELLTKIQSSLNLGWAPFVNSNSERPFNSVASGHYVSIIGYDATSGYVYIANCHYAESVFGIYAVRADFFCGNIRQFYCCEQEEVQP